MENSLYKLKKGVMVSEFDDGNMQDGKPITYIICLDDRYWKVSQLIYRIFLCMEEATTIKEIQGEINDRYSIQLTTEKIQSIVDLAFVNNGLLEGTRASSEKKKNKMIWGKITLLKPSLMEQFRGLKIFFKKKCLIVFTGMILFWMSYILSSYSNDVVFTELVNMNFREVIFSYFFIIIAGIVHEYGHSVAAMSFGAKPGRIGVGVYMIMPVMFSDVTDVWRLDRKKRVMVDLGGMYFQGLFLVICFIINNLVVHYYIWNIAILLSGFQILSNLNPFIKLDGYWILADYLGVGEIKQVVLTVWKDLVWRKKRKITSNTLLAKDKKVVIYIYSIFTGCFYVYFIRLLFNSFVLAIARFGTDVLLWRDAIISGKEITISSIMNYVTDRISSLIVLIFVIKILYGAIMSIQKLLKGRNKI